MQRAHACDCRYLDVSCLVYGAGNTFLEPVDYDHRISSEAIGEQGAVQHSGTEPLQPQLAPAVLHVSLRGMPGIQRAKRRFWRRQVTSSAGASGRGSSLSALT
jgi:hypothetical protein